MKNCLISVVIPSYNVESYIERCITSILSQTYRNIQVIVVDDVSKDRTCDIVERIARNDDRVTLHKSEVNGGSAVARQIGIEISSGELLTFVDADDCYNSDFVLERVANEFAKRDVDCVMFGYRTIHAKIILKKKISSRIGLYTVREAFIDKVKNKTVHWNYLWNKVYRSEVVKNNIRFQPSLRMAEDVRFNVDFMKVAKSFMVIPDLYYDYNCSNPNQVTRSNKSSKSTIQSYKDYYQHIVNELDDLLLQAKYYNAVQEVKDMLHCDFYKKCERLFIKLEGIEKGVDFKLFIISEPHYLESKKLIGSRSTLINIILKLEDIKVYIKSILKNILNR